MACAKSLPLSSPNTEKFHQLVASPALQDSLRHGKLTIGMPYFAAAEIFNRQKGTRRIPVPGVGSAQRLEESEGWGRRFQDPNIKVYMDEYPLAKGKLRLWYQLPDFYRMGVAAGDTLYAWRGGAMLRLAIACLLHENRLQTAGAMNETGGELDAYGEIRHFDHPQRKISHWYNLKSGRDLSSFSLTGISYELYPILWMEWQGEPVASFSWKQQ